MKKTHIRGILSEDVAKRPEVAAALETLRQVGVQSLSVDEDAFVIDLNGVLYSMEKRKSSHDAEFMAGQWLLDTIDNASNVVSFPTNDSEGKWIDTLDEAVAEFGTTEFPEEDDEEPFIVQLLGPNWKYILNHAAERAQPNHFVGPLTDEDVDN